mmetsp:Transcript_18442/g.50754  ORF Transcript_18442/g.50754 Transcript_18442/m.50754 type:complete len:202 (+) Transcript_18442:397-1002(+)
MCFTASGPPGNGSACAGRSAARTGSAANAGPRRLGGHELTRRWRMKPSNVEFSSQGSRNVFRTTSNGQAPASALPPTSCTSAAGAILVKLGRHGGAARALMPGAGERGGTQGPRVSPQGVLGGKLPSDVLREWIWPGPPPGTARATAGKHGFGTKMPGGRRGNGAGGASAARAASQLPWSGWPRQARAVRTRVPPPPPALR